ncbi:MAG: hypothetical protein ABIN89_01915 [Chitinophagaceae bacterium]
MANILSIGFEYNGTPFSFLARVKERGNFTEYHITVMNGALEKLLYGDHIIFAVNGQIEINIPVELNEQHQLKIEVAKALNLYLKEQSLTSY